MQEQAVRADVPAEDFVRLQAAETDRVRREEDHHVRPEVALRVRPEGHVRRAADFRARQADRRHQDREVMAHHRPCVLRAADTREDTVLRPRDVPADMSALSLC